VSVRRLLALLVLALALVPTTAFAAQPRVSLPDIEDEVMCVECGTALNVSQAPSADRQRAFIRRRIAEGKTKEQIKAALVAEYGRNVLGTPDNRGFDAANWIVPAVLALVALLAVFTTARRWRRAGASRGADDGFRPGSADRPLTPEEARRLERDMAGYDL
jgi:cytochrome c-type biogenesis protein CcmH